MRTIAFDNETFLITRERPFPPVVCTAWHDGVRGAVVPHTGNLPDVLSAWLRDPERSFVGHHVAYDFGTLAASWPELLPGIFEAYKAGRVTDTQIRQQLFDIATGRTIGEGGDELRGYGLAGLYELIFDEPMPGPGKTGGDGWRLRYGELYDVPFGDWPDEAIEYSGCDAAATMHIFEAQEQKAGELLRDDAAQSYAAFCFTLMSAQGMRTDASAVARLKAEQLAIMEALEPELVAAGMLEAKTRGRGDAKVRVGWTKKTRPAQERIAASCQALGVEPLLTKGGIKLKRDGKPTGLEHVSIDRTACHHARDAFMLRRAEYVTAEKILSTYVPFLEAGVDGPITSRINLAATGRTTSSTPRGPAVGGNQQNQPRFTKRIAPKKIDFDIVVDPMGGDSSVDVRVHLEQSPNGVRECFVPRPGKIFLSADLASAEMHGLAQVCFWKFGFSTLGETLNAGLDPHLNVARYLEGGIQTPSDYDEMYARYKQGDPDVETFRFNAKKANFGFGGHMMERTFVKTMLREGMHWTVQEAHALREAWLASDPAFQLYFDACKAELGPGGSALVEYYHSKRLRKVRNLTTLCNGYFQCLVADGAKRAVCEVVRRCYVGGNDYGTALYANNTRPVNFVHDDLVTETDDNCESHPELMGYVVDEFVATLQDEFNVVTPDFPTTVDPVLSYKLSKRAESVRDSEGRLIPWTD